MSLYFGPIFQNGFAVHEWRPAAEHWIEVMGVGPFFIMEHIEFEWTYPEPPTEPVRYYVRVEPEDGNLAWSPPIWTSPAAD